MAKKLSDEVLKWTIEINGDQARKSLHELEQTTRELEGTNKSLKTELAKLEAQGKKNTAEYDAISKSITNNNKVIQGNKQQMAALREEIGITGLTMRELRSRAKELQNQLDNMTPESDSYNILQGELVKVRSRMDELRISTKAMGSDQNSLKKTTEGVQLSLGEMKKELRELRNMSFAGMNPEEIKQIRERMARLTEEIRDFQEQNMAASESGIPAFVAGLQGIVASVQLVTGTLSLFGIENEKLEKSMVQLIGVAQALATVEDIYARGKFKVMAATAQDTIEKVKNTVATKGQTLATEGATIATRLLGKAMTSMPLLTVIAGLTAIAAGIAVLIVRMRSQINTTKLITDATKAANEATADEIAKVQVLAKVANDKNQSLEKRKSAIEEINKISPEYLGNITLENIGTQESIDKINDYIIGIQRKAKAMAYNKMLSEKYIELAEAEMNTWESLGAAQKAFYKMTASGVSAQSQHQIAQALRVNSIYEEIEAIKELAAAEYDANNAGGGGGGGGGNKNNNINEFSIPDADDDAAEARALERFNYRIELDKREADEKLRIKTQFDSALKQKENEAIEEQEEVIQNKLAAEEARNQVRSELRLNSEQQIYEESKKQLDFYLHEKYISEEEHAKLLKQLDADMLNSRMQKWNQAFEFIGEMAGQFTNLVTGMMDVELEKAGDNERKQKQIRKKYADLQFIATIASMFANQGLGVTKIWSEWGANPVLAGLLTGGLLAATIPQIMMAQAQRAKVKQLATGNIGEVIGKSDGRTYKPDLLKSVKTGFYNKPYMALFNENPNRPELVVDGATTAKLKLNYPEVVETIRYVSQHATGKYDAITAPGSSTTTSQNTIQRNNDLTAVLINSVEKLNNTIDDGIGVSYDKLNKSDNDITNVFSKTTL